jgi:ABC-2 type transport system permease protein
LPLGWIWVPDHDVYYIYGNMVMRSVIEEKTNRIEIIISSVKPFQLMIGKIIGTSLAGILQFLYGL